MRTKALALAILLLQTSITYADESPQNYAGIPQAVLEKISKKDLRGMFRAMASNAFDKDKAEESNAMLDGFIKQFEEQFKDTGDYLDASLYREEHFGDRYVVQNYVLNYAHKPMGLTLQLYNGQKGWRATNVNFTPDIDKFVNEMHGTTPKGKS